MMSLTRVFVPILAGGLLFATVAFSRVVPSPSDCTSSEHWVAPHTKQRKAGPVFYSGHCAQNPSGYSFWRPMLRDVRPKGWPHAKEKTKLWKTGEIEDVVDALALLPDELKLKHVKGICRMDRSVFDGNAGSFGDGYIILYESAFSDGDIRRLSRLLAHELAHEYFQNLPDSVRQEYEAATKWVRYKDHGKVRYIFSRTCCYVDQDGKISPDEDFANNIEYFLFDNSTLKEFTETAHTWIRKRFDDSFKLRRTVDQK